MNSDSSDLFQDFLTNYNKMFIERSSDFFNPNEENAHTITEFQVQNNNLSNMEEQYEIIEDDYEGEKLTKISNI